MDGFVSGWELIGDTPPDCIVWVSDGFSMCVAEFYQGRWRSWFAVNADSMRQLGQLETGLWFEPVYWQPVPKNPKQCGL